MSKLISFSLYGNAIKYILGLYENLNLAESIYPGWQVRVYVTENHYCIDKIKKDWPNVQVVERPETIGSAGMFWRLEGAYDTEYSHCIVRDVDSRLNEREASLVKQWVESGKDLHIIRDHPAHNNVPILGGAHGYVTASFKYLEDIIKNWSHTYKYGDDEHLLRVAVYNITHTNQILCHSSQGTHYNDETPIAPLQDDYICRPTIPPFEPYLDKLYVLNAKHYSNRFKKFLEAIKESSILSNLDIIRVEGTEISNEVTPYWASKKYPHYWVASEDHKRLIRSRILAKHDLTLIFEDDAHPIPEFDEFFKRMWEYADPYADNRTWHAPWTALMLGGQDDKKRSLLHGHTSQMIARADGTRGQHSILYNHKGMYDFYSHAVYWNYKTIDEAFETYQLESKTVYCPAKWITEAKGTQYGKDN
jgi:hypothetical protein